jgi:hypothetical protein
MLLDEQHQDDEDTELAVEGLFKKRENHLNIGALQTRGTTHVQRNKLSDKFSRRDI